MGREYSSNLASSDSATDFPESRSVYRSRRTSRESSEAAVPRPGIRDDTAAAPRSNRPVFLRPRVNARIASITVETILSFFADFALKPVMGPQCHCSIVIDK